MSWCGCSLKPFVAVMTVGTTAAFPTFLYFTYRDIDINTTDNSVILHILSGASALVGIAFFCKMMYSLVLNYYEDWRVDLIFVYVASFLAAFFEMKVTLISITLGSWLVMLLLTCMELPRSSQSGPQDSETEPIVVRVGGDTYVPVYS